MTFASWLREHSYNLDYKRFPILRILHKFQSQNPNASFRTFWLMHGNGDSESYERCKEEFLGMKNTRDTSGHPYGQAFPPFGPI